MARIFISHSGRDNECAGELRAWLGGLGFEAPFLDIDKDFRDPAGCRLGADALPRDRARRRRHRRTHGELVASKWCFAEFTQARALGKPIFPVIETPAGERLVAKDIQHLDLREDREGGLARLARELERIASDIHRGYRFPPGRPPYPGLFAFDEDDAAIYFGRNDEIRRLTGLLRAQRASGSANIWAILGASGSGKSSLLRAGILPAMEQEAPAWTVLPAFRLQGPADRGACIDRGARAGRTRPGCLAASAGRRPDAALTEFELRLKGKVGLAETQIVVPIDQFEELLTLAPAEQAGAAWRLLKMMSERRAVFLVVLTLRSDFLDRLQAAPGRSFDIVPFTLDPLPKDRIRTSSASPRAWLA